MALLKVAYLLPNEQIGWNVCCEEVAVRVRDSGKLVKVENV